MIGAVRKEMRKAYRRVVGPRGHQLGAELRQRRLGAAVVNDIGRTIHIDPADARGRRIYAGGGADDVHAVRIWRTIVEAHDPDTVIDVGANYGEVAFSHRYSPGTRVYLIEANPRVARHLARSIVDPDLEVLHVCAASDHPGVAKLHTRGVTSSGRSSLRPLAKARRSIKVPLARIDDLVPTTAATRVCIKIDVEGAEVDVLRGMDRILRETDWVGLVEYLHMAPDELDWLQATFDLRAVTLGTHRLVSAPQLASLSKSRRQQLGLAKDVVVAPIGRMPAALLD